jgi:mono/diheme cytochrome c family protein
MKTSVILIGTLAFVLLGVNVRESHSADSAFLDRVATIFQQRCLSCHNDAEHKGDFSLQTSASAFQEGYIEAGDSAASHLVELITPVDGKAKMPKDADPLSPAEIAAIRNWIDAGAKWPAELKLTESSVADLNWWSLRPLKRPALPVIWNARQDPNSAASTKQPGQLRLRTEIDAFIQATLTKKGLTASAEADRATLVRRLYFDLVGLPPTPEQIAAFVSDKEPNAYERLVDHLLDSDGYGERWARHWLDVVHYADTHGYDKDKLRPNAWPYRDYVIRSLNDDKPYERFVREQIAGDALWPDTIDGITATGFIAAGPWDFIGHAEVPESKIDGKVARNMDRDDMVTSTMNTFCSVTVQCARCHNHKFDPITQEHYYSLQSVFAALDRADRTFDADPQTTASRRELMAREEALGKEKTRLDAVVAEKAGEKLVPIDAKLAELQKQKEAAGGAKPEFGYHSNIEKKQDAIKWVQVDLGEPTPIASVLYVGCHDPFNGIGHGFGFPLRYRIEASDDESFKTGVTTLADHTKVDVPNPGTNPQSLTAPAGLKARFVRMTATRLAPRQNDFILALAELSVLTPDGSNAASNKPVASLDSIQAPVRWQRKNLVDGYYFGVTAAPDIQIRVAKLMNERTEILASVLSDELKSQIAENEASVKTTDAAIKALPGQSRVYAGMIHHGNGNFVGTGGNGGKPRIINILHRGNVQQPRGVVGPGTIPIIATADWKFQLPESHSEGDRRVALAEWIVSRNNPLTWRSIVNRVWQYHFGRGIVDSPNDLGRMGQLPTHPELLDWLAVEFRDGGQSLKMLHRLIVTSSVYRQESVHNEANSRIDSGNAHLWRMNRRRLTAEEVRDSVLAVSGKLDRKMFGPGFQLFVLEHPQHSPHYEYHKHDPDDPASHRRSVYRFIGRSQPDPFMTTLDCADSSQSVPRRDETTTALQALSLLNNKFMLRMAEQFSDRLKMESDSSSEQIARAFQLATGRQANAQQIVALTEYANEFGTENLCRLLFNLNEFVFVD